MPKGKLPSGVWVLMSASLLCAVLGSIHAFSVFLRPLETQFGIARSTASLFYSLALVSLTVSVLCGHLVFTRLKPSLLVSAFCGLAALGAFVAGTATHVSMIFVGYSLLFGAANGLGYGFGLQLSAQANPGREGLAMGIVTASYAFGAALSPALFSSALSNGGFEWAMSGLALMLLAILPLCALTLERSGIRFRAASAERSENSVGVRKTLWLWLGYGAGVAAGLMAIGHATGIAVEAGLKENIWVAPMVIAVFNLAGSVSGGWLTDRMKPVVPLVGLPVLSAIVLVLLAVAHGGFWVMTGLAIIGLCYGAIIAVYPAVIAKLCGPENSTRIYGRVFTAWGTAGLIAPWFAGYLFDVNGGYFLALIVAALISFVSAAAALGLHWTSLRSKRSEEG